VLVKEAQAQNVATVKNIVTFGQMVQQAAKDTVNKVLGPMAPTNEVIQRNNELIEANNALNHSDTETEDNNTPNIPPQTPDQTPVPTPEPKPIATPFHKNVVFDAHGTKWNNIPVGMHRSINGDIPFKEWELRLPTGDIWREGDNTDESISRLNVFYNSSQRNNCMIHLLLQI
jgi:hypothetical protein